MVPTTVFCVNVPVKAQSLNQSGRQTHWGQRSSRAKLHRIAVAWAMAEGKHKPVVPCVVTLMRIAPSNGLDGDNLQGSLKSVRDGVAAWLGVDDADPRVEWKYSQERGKVFSVLVTVQAGLYRA